MADVPPNASVIHKAMEAPFPAARPGQTADMPISSDDLYAALATAGLSDGDYVLSADGARLRDHPGLSLPQSHVRITVTPEIYQRLEQDGWREAAAGYLGHGILLASARGPMAEATSPIDARQPHDTADPTAVPSPGYTSSVAFAAHALVRPRAAARRAQEQRFGWSAWIVALVVTLVGSLTSLRGPHDMSGPPVAVTVLAAALIGAPLLLLVVTALIWLVRQFCGSRYAGVAHGRSTVAAVTQTVVADAVPMLVMELAVSLLNHDAGTAIGALAMLWGVVITVLLASAMFRVSVVRAALAVVSAYLCFTAICSLLYAAISLASS